MRARFSQLRSADWLLAFAALTLVLFGLSAIYSVALSKGADFLNLKKQLVAVALASSAFFLAAFSNYRLLRNYSVILYLFGIVMLVAVLFFGDTIRGTTGWFDLGAFSFQPVEFMKVALAIALATYFSRRARTLFGLRELLETGLITAVPVLLVLIQPDFGSASLLAGMWFVLVLFAGIGWKQLFALAGIGLVLGALGWAFFFEDYQKARIEAFLNPAVDPLGQGYQVNQAIIAVGAGGWFGRGLGFGSQSQLKFLPESQTDFIFAVIAEELGFLGVMLVLGAFMLVFIRIYQWAARSNDDFTSFLLLAIGGLLFVQFSVNVGMNLGLLPVTGVSLPLVSYGGSSLLATLVMIGVVESVAIRSRRES